MYKPDFEKNVQQQMQELRFHPSDEVWKRVEAGIVPAKRRRPLLFFLIFIGLLLGGSLYFIFSNRPVGNRSYNASQVLREPVSQPPDNKSVIPGKRKVPTENKINAHPKKGKPINTVGPHLSVARHNTDIQRHLTKALVKSIALNKTGNSKSKISEPDPVILENDFNIHEVNSGEPQINPAFPIGIPDKKPITTAIINGDKLLMDGVDEKMNIQKDSISNQVSVKNHSPAKQKKWQWGLDASLGVADVSNQLFQRASTAGLNYTPSSVMSGNLNFRSSEVSKGISFSIGAFTSKSIGRKWNLRLGLSYQYFSNSIRTGERIDSLRVINQGNLSMDRVSQYYKSAGNNRYTNHYHFISLPVAVQWQLGKHFIWENAVAFSRLINTNALHYDGVSGTYYENRNLFNDYQFFVSTSFLVCLYKNKLAAGPQFQYGLSNLLDRNAENPKHLRQLGLKTSLTLSKK